MKPDIDYQQLFAWAVQLTAKTDYQSLTHEFLGLAGQLPCVDSVAVYEVYGGHHRKSGEAGAVRDQLIKRFPLGFSDQTQDVDPDLLLAISETQVFNPSKPDADGFFTQLLASIRDVCGPERAVLLRGRFDAKALKVLSDLIGIYRNQVALHDSKERDLLTKLPNRQSFDARFLQVCEYYRCQLSEDGPPEKSSWMAMLDIDHFKRVNDTFGHLYGDEVLLVFSQLMEKNFRFNDFLFRFGGEEFVVILNLVSENDAQAAFERFRKSVAAHLFPAVGQVTVSIGATHIDSAIMPTTLLDRADTALYRAKETGRNQLVMYEKNREPSSDDDGENVELF